jgi:thiol:disulfide interchange protein
VNRFRNLVFLAWILALPGLSQRLNPVHWSMTVDPATAAPGGHVLARMIAKMDEGWHLYALSVPPPIIATKITLEDNPAVASYKIYTPKPRTAFDQNFGFNLDTFEKEAVFLVDVELAKSAPAGPLELAAKARYQTCDNKSCLPPRTVPVSAALTVAAGAKAEAAAIPAGYTLFDPSAPPPSAPAAAEAAPAPEPAAPASVASQQGLLMFILVAFGVGLAAIFTPCVFPMIPITVSFFLDKPAGSRGRSVFDAVLFCGGIIVLFTALGLATTAILGPFGVVQLGSNVWVNAFIVVVFLIFSLSLLGAFEITIPSGVLTRLDRASKGGGALGTLLMGLTFSLAAFACVGPFVGTLLAASVSSGGARPLIGMVTFAAGLSTPFFFLALFPSYLKRLPRSGMWMERVKVVMGFLVLAAMFKYLASIDQVMRWNLLTRDRFLAAWIVLFGLAGLYLLGLLRLPGVKRDDPLGVMRLLVGAALVAFAISLVPGMFGARLGELDAYVPAAADTASVIGGSARGEQLEWMTNRYQDALAKARQENKLVLVSFTGYACTNCHWMKANMFTRPEVASAMRDFVLVELYTDGTDEASRQNQALQESKFATVAIPYYAILTPDEKVVAQFPSLTRDPAEFLAFLKKGTA